MTNNIQGNSYRLSADFSTEILWARREWHDIFKLMRGKNLQPRILYTARLSFRFDGEIQSFPDKQKLREFSTTKNSFVTNTKGTSRGTKHKRRKRPTQNKPKTIKKMVIGPYCCSVVKSCLTLWPHRLQDAKLPYPSPSPRVCSNSCSLSQRCHPIISSSVTPFSSCLWSFPESRSFQWVNSSHQVAKGLELQYQFFQWIFRVDFL